MTTYDKFAAFFVTTLLLGCGYMIYSASQDRAECVKSTVAQNYPAEQIRKICR